MIEYNTLQCPCGIALTVPYATVIEFGTRDEALRMKDEGGGMADDK